jgi:hypothetical protein
LMSTHEVGTSTATTPSERSIRIAALAFDANREYLQVLLELGAKRAQELNEMASGPTLDAGVLRLAADITETFEPVVPAFERGEEVSRADCDPIDARLLGKVDYRYLNERGEWEYDVRLAGPGRRVGTYAEADIAPFPVRDS